MSQGAYCPERLLSQRLLKVYIDFVFLAPPHEISPPAAPKSPAAKGRPGEPPRQACASRDSRLGAVVAANPQPGVSGRRCGGSDAGGDFEGRI